METVEKGRELTGVSKVDALRMINQTIEELLPHYGCMDSIPQSVIMGTVVKGRMEVGMSEGNAVGIDDEVNEVPISQQLIAVECEKMACASAVEGEKMTGVHNKAYEGKVQTEVDSDKGTEIVPYDVAEQSDWFRSTKEEGENLISKKQNVPFNEGSFNDDTSLKAIRQEIALLIYDGEALGLKFASNGDQLYKEMLDVLSGIDKRFKCGGPRYRDEWKNMNFA